MTDTEIGEIRASYRAAANPKKQIQILAELHATSAAEIRKIVQTISGVERPKDERRGEKARARWTEQQTELLTAMVDEGQSVVNMAKMLGLTAQQVRSKCALMGVRLRDLGKDAREMAAEPGEVQETAQQTELLIDMIDGGKSLAEMAQVLGLSTKQVWSKCEMVRDRLRRDTAKPLEVAEPEESKRELPQKREPEAVQALPQAREPIADRSDAGGQVRTASDSGGQQLTPTDARTMEREATAQVLRDLQTERVIFMAFDHFTAEVQEGGYGLELCYCWRAALTRIESIVMTWADEVRRHPAAEEHYAVVFALAALDELAQRGQSV